MTRRTASLPCGETKEQVMRRTVLVVVTLALALVAYAMPVPQALASSPHFITVSASGPNNGGNLIVSWKEAGLGNNQTVNYVASADATAVYACINGGNNHPKASNKATVSGPVSAPGTFSSGQNGQITESLTLSPPSAGSFSCPSGQRLVLASVSYTNVQLRDTTTPISVPIPGTFSRTFFNV
jgi:hypothetical protein